MGEKENTKDNSNAFTPYDEALWFAHAYRVLIERFQSFPFTRVYLDACLITPAIVNGSFAAELFLKSLIDKVIYSHKLYDLYCEYEITEPQEALYIKIKTVEKMTDLANKIYSMEEFDDDLKSFSSAFEELRYGFEPNRIKNDSYYLLFLDCFLLSLQGSCEKRFGKRPIT